VSIRLYHLAHEMNMHGSDLLQALRERGLPYTSLMKVLGDEEVDRARRVAKGESAAVAEAGRRPSLTDEIKLPPPVVPAPVRSPRQPPSRQPKRTPLTQRPAPTTRRGIKIFKQKEIRERRGDRHGDKAKAEEMFAGRTIPVSVPISLKDFSQEIGVKTNVLLLHLMKQGIMANPNTSLDEETVLVLAEGFNRTVEIQSEKSVEEELEEMLQTDETKPSEELAGRPPIVAVLGHVDHGKTSLLDYIRKTRVAAGEAGGITQHIGAYSVTLPNGQKLSFLDTPGHEAFTQMRARGARLTDIVILIVAADDGVMPQTEEALAHARAANVPIVVAINKCDRAEANADRVRQQLSGLNLAPEEWGGETGMLELSAKTGKGIDALLERLALEAELLDLKASPEKTADGYVVEASKQTGRGVVATLLIKDGTLNRGDYVLCGASQGRVKSMTNDIGKQVKTAPPSMAIQITGLDEVPEAGQRFQVVRNKDLAKKAATQRGFKKREKALAAKAHGSFEKLMDRMGGGGAREQNIVLKADVKGSIEAIRAKLEESGSEEVKVKLLHAAVGGITESDIVLAEASDAIILGFHVVADAKARAAAEAAGVKIRTYSVIYELLDDIHRALEGMLPKDIEEKVIGHAEIREIFMYKKSRIGGCMVLDGLARRTAKVRLSRDGRVLIENGALESLKRFKDDAKEVKEGYECGLKVESFEDIKVGDQLEFYELEEKTRTL